MLTCDASLPFALRRLRRRFTVVCGQQRSANRTKWTGNSGGGADRTKSVTTPSPRFAENALDESATSRRFAREEIWKEATRLQGQFFQIDRLVAANGRRVRAACRDHGLGPHHFAGSTGYGHGDLGRGTLDKIVAQSFGAESAIIRHQFVSGTHAIATALFGVLRPGHELVCITGRPYDTLHDVIGHQNCKDSVGSLQDWGVSYTELEWNGVEQVVYVQRSCGYASRPSLSIAEIEGIVSDVRGLHPNCPVLVDNCYGEFTEEREPTDVGADLIMGSLIKNPGGAIAATGGYVAGKERWMRPVHTRLTAPGVGIDAGCVSGESLRLMFQGFCLAPQMVGEALKSATLISHVMSKHGYRVQPEPSSTGRQDIITAVELGSELQMTQFCSAVQKCSPVGSYVRPIPGSTPGYEDDVIFADGTFVDGSTSELSADGPIRPPFTVYCQGGTHWTHWAEALENILTELH